MYSLTFGSFLWSAPVQDKTAHHCFLYFIKLFYIFYKKFCWYCECTQIKVDPLQFRMMYYSYLYEQKLRSKLFPLKKKCNWLHWWLPLSAQSTGCSTHLSRFNCFSISIDFILGKLWGFENAKLIKHGYDQLTVCRWPLGPYFKKEKTYLTNKKNAPNIFLN